MDKLAVMGANGSLGSEVVRQAVERFDVTAFVRPGSAPRETRHGPATVRELDLDTATVQAIADALAGHRAVVNAAGHVRDGDRFVRLVDRLVDALESLPENERPVCWFVAGAAALDLDRPGRRGVDLPVVRSRYWPHRVNHERLLRSTLDWRLLCPGPMVAEPMLDDASLRTSVDRLPTGLPRWASGLPGPLLTLVFARLVPQMIVPYANAASLMLANLAPGGFASRRRVGLALPAGERGQKDRWS